MHAHKIKFANAAAVSGLLSIGGFAFPAHAQQQNPVTVVAHQDQFRRVVPFGDLTTAAGRRLLIERVSLAVEQVCPAQDEYGVPIDVIDCHDVAWRGARPQIKSAFDRVMSGASMAMSLEITSVAAK